MSGISLKDAYNKYVSDCEVQNDLRSVYIKFVEMFARNEIHATGFRIAVWKNELIRKDFWDLFISRMDLLTRNDEFEFILCTNSIYGGSRYGDVYQNVMVFEHPYMEPLASISTPGRKAASGSWEVTAAVAACLFRQRGPAFYRASFEQEITNEVREKLGEPPLGEASLTKLVRRIYKLWEEEYSDDNSKI